MSQRDPSVVTFRPKTEIWRDGDTWMACFGEFSGDTPAVGCGETIPAALRSLADELEQLESVKLEQALGGAKLE